MAKKTEKHLTPDQRARLFSLLKSRFENHRERHPGLTWAVVQARLETNGAKLWSLHEMEQTGGEPDVVVINKKTGEVTFMDCAPESPAGRRSVCYDREGLESRKEARPKTSAIDMANDMGVEMLTEAQYRDLQRLGIFDTKTSSWLTTPPAIRKLGGAIFADFRYGQVFVYHNGAQSYYAARGFRASLKV